ncbi:MAG: cytochrome c [Acidipila sp.]|nr:cytochrome c [Acidipila sp.]
MRKLWFLGAGLLVTAALLAVPARADSATETLYKTKCATCHGPDGKGDTPAGKKMGAHDFTSPDVQKRTDAQLSEAIAKRKNKMPGYEKSLKPEQIKDLVAYIRELGKKN